MRGIELGGIGRAAALAPAMGRAGSIGPARIGAFPAPKFEAGIKNIANPFRAEAKDSILRTNFKTPGVDNRVRMPIIQSEFRKPFVLNLPKPRPTFSVQSVIAEAEAIVRAKQASTTPPRREVLRAVFKAPEPMVVWLPKSVRGLEVKVLTHPNQATRLEANPVVKSLPAFENAVTSANKTAVVTQTEQMIEEKTIVKQPEEQKLPAQKKEKMKMLVVRLVEASHISEKRREEIRVAVDKLDLKAISGRLVSRLLSISFWQHKSPIVGQGKDWTIDLTARALEADTKEYQSAEEAKQNLVQVVDKHIPVKEGEGGRMATYEEVREVLEGKQKEIFRSNTPAEMVIKRVMVKKSETVAGPGQAVTTMVEEQEEVRGKPTLKSLGLEELFPKAAA